MMCVTAYDGEYNTLVQEMRSIVKESQHFCFTGRVSAHCTGYSLHSKKL